MKRAILTAGLAMLLMTVSAQENSYIVKTSNAKKKVAVENLLTETTSVEEEETANDFVGQYFKYYSLCDWKEGMKFMVMPEKYDLVVKTFADAGTGKEVSSMSLRHKIMIYKGKSESSDGHWRINFQCQDDNKMYYYEIPSGTFDDYCYGKLGVPTLAYLGDVDIAREQLMGKKLFTKTRVYRVDTESDGDGYRETIQPMNKEVEVKAIGVGTRSFPVKIIVEDELGNEYYQVVAMSKTNSGMRDDEFIMDSLKHTFYGAFELQDAVMKVNKDYKTYIGQVIHNKYKTEMVTKGDGKERYVTIPKMMSFRVDNTLAQPNTEYVTLTLTEIESRRVFYKDVTFTNPAGKANARAKEDEYFGYLFAMGEGQARETSQAARAAIQQGRVIVGMSEDEVLLAMGEEPARIETSNDGRYMWLYQRSKGYLTVTFGRNGRVESYTTPAENNKSKKTTARRKAATKPKANNEWQRSNGTPL
jgi:hypothetical protein